MIQQSIMSMEMLPEFAGGAVFHASQGVLASHTTNSPNASFLIGDGFATFCRTFYKMYSTGKMKLGEVSGATCYYSGSVAVFKRIRENVFFITVFERDVELSVISLAIDSVLHELRQLPLEVTVASTPSASAPSAASAPTDPSPQEFGRFRFMISTLQTNLIDLAGPIGEMLCADALDGLPENERLPEKFPQILSAIYDDLDASTATSLKARLTAAKIQP